MKNLICDTILAFRARGPASKYVGGYALLPSDALRLADNIAAVLRSREREFHHASITALDAAMEFIEEEAENRAAAGSEASDYEQEPRVLAERLRIVTHALRLLRASGSESPSALDAADAALATTSPVGPMT